MLRLLNEIPHWGRQIHWMDAKILLELWIDFNLFIVIENVSFPLFLELFSLFFKLFALNFPKLIKTDIWESFAFLTDILFALDLLQGHLVVSQIFGPFICFLIHVWILKHLVLKNMFPLEICLLRRRNFIICVEERLKEDVLSYTLHSVVSFDVFFFYREWNRRKFGIIDNSLTGFHQGFHSVELFDVSACCIVVLSLSQDQIHFTFWVVLTGEIYGWL